MTKILYSTPSGMLLQATQVAIEPAPMGPEETKTFSDTLSESIDIAKALIEIGNAFTEFVKDEKAQHAWKAKFAVLGSLGDIFKGILKILPDPEKEEDPLIGQLQDLADRIVELGDQVSKKFNEMKALISEVNFFTNILSPTFVLSRCMRDCINHPGEKSKKNFTSVYLRSPPLHLFYNLMSYLEQKSTNPVRQAMNAENGKTKETFKRWENIISQIMGQFMFIEAFAGGLLGHNNGENCSVLIDKSIEVFKQMNEWKNEYERDQGYWQEVNNWLGPWLLTENYRLKHSEKADAIQKKLDSYLTSDSFYILVFNEAEWKNDYYYYCLNYKDQIIGVWNQRRCNIIIYRSKKGNDMAQLEYDNSKREVKACMPGKLKKTGNLENITKTQLVDKKYVRPDGLICLVDKSKDLEVRSANCTGHQWGPGWWERVDIDSGDQHSVKTLVVGLP